MRGAPAGRGRDRLRRGDDGHGSRRRRLEPKLTKALTAPSLSLGRTAALAVDVATGTIIYAHNASLPGRTGLEREDPRLVGRADEPRGGLPLPHGGLRQRYAVPVAPGTAI